MGTVKSDVSGFDKRAYRNALGCFATGVCLIATRDDQGRPRAMTANSFTSVSLDPPIILWAVDIHSERCRLFTEAEQFSVSFLRGDQADYSRRFARHPDAVLTDDEVVYGTNRVPRFSDALAYVECDTGWRHKAGDHIVIFGNVIGFGSEMGDALGFFRGQYSSVSAGDA